MYCACACVRRAVVHSAADTVGCGAGLLAVGVVGVPHSGYKPRRVVLCSNGMTAARSCDLVFRVLVVLSDLVHEGQRHTLDRRQGTWSTVA